MKKSLILFAAACCLFATPAFAWQDTSSTTYKILGVQHEIRGGAVPLCQVG